MILLHLSAVIYLLSVSCLAADTDTGDEAIEVTMCCPEGKVLKLTSYNRPGRIPFYSEYVPKCVHSWRSITYILDGSAITVTDTDAGDKDMVVKKTGVMLPNCPLGLIVKRLALNTTGSDEKSEDKPIKTKSNKRVRLGDFRCGYPDCEEGNVYVDDKPVCDDEWDNEDAEVVCKELGFDGGVATTESKYGLVDLEKQSCMDEVECSGRESSLLDCLHIAQDDCKNDEGAGVVCYKHGKGADNFFPLSKIADEATTSSLDAAPGSGYVFSSTGSSAQTLDLPLTYERTGDTHGGYPVFRAKEKESALFVDDNGYWGTARKVGQFATTAYNSAWPTPGLPPLYGWKFGRNGWEEDPDLHLTLAPHLDKYSKTISGDCYDYTTAHTQTIVRLTRVQSAERCQVQCQAQPGCNYFTWYKHGDGDCWLNSEQNVVREKCAGCTSGPKYCRGTGKTEQLAYKWVLMDSLLPQGALIIGGDNDDDCVGDCNVYVGRQEKYGENLVGKFDDRNRYIACCYPLLMQEKFVEASEKFSVLCLEPDAEAEWVQFREGELPDDLVIGGIIGGKAQYVGRGIIQTRPNQTQTTPGMFVPREAKLLALYGGGVHELNNFEVLVVRKNGSKEKTNEEFKDYDENSDPKDFGKESESKDYGEESDSKDYDKESESELDKRIKLSSSGQMTVPGTIEALSLSPTTYEAGQFCLAGVWEGDLPVGKEEAVALMCHPCKSQVMCASVLQIFTAFDLTQKDSARDLTMNVILVGDKNGDAVVDFEEFKTMLEEYAEKVFNYFDSHGDGVLDGVQIGDLIKNIRLKLVLDALDEMFAFWDVNQDDQLSVKEIVPGLFHDRYNDVKTSLKDVLGVSPINLPEPLYRLYTALDADKNEIISFDEAKTFIKGAFVVIDQNEDCAINLDELIMTLEESKLPTDFQLAVKLIGEHYITLTDFVLKQFITAADTDGDNMTTFEEITNLRDPDVIESCINVAVRMGQPTKAAADFLVGQGRGRHEKEAVLEMWLNVLSEFVDNKRFYSDTTDLCGME